MSEHDPVNQPRHYTSHPSGVECITITEHMGFNVGNAIKYLWRADEKGNAVEDLKKAAWYVAREIERRQKPVTWGVDLASASDEAVSQVAHGTLDPEALARAMAR